MRLPFGDCRSDAEARGLEVLDAARLEIPAVNEIIAGEEADFSWARLRLIVEIDGPDFHRFADEDARKTAAWRAAGWTVRRIPSDRVYDAPRELVRWPGRRRPAGERLSWGSRPADRAVGARPSQDGRSIQRMSRLVRMDASGHATLAEWTADDAEAVEPRRDRLPRAARPGYFAMVSTGEGHAEQVRELPLDAPLVIMRLPISGG